MSAAAVSPARAASNTVSASTRAGWPPSRCAPPTACRRPPGHELRRRACTRARDPLGAGVLGEGAEERHLAGGARVAAHELPADDDAGADPLAGEHADEVVDVARRAPPALGRARPGCSRSRSAVAARACASSAPARSKPSGKTLLNRTRAASRVHRAGAADAARPAAVRADARVIERRRPRGRRMAASRSVAARTSPCARPTTSPRRSATAARTLTSPMSSPARSRRRRGIEAAGRPPARAGRLAGRPPRASRAAAGRPRRRRPSAATAPCAATSSVTRMRARPRAARRARAGHSSGAGGLGSRASVTACRVYFINNPGKSLKRVRAAHTLSARSFRKCPQGTIPRRRGGSTWQA